MASDDLPFGVQFALSRAEDATEPLDKVALWRKPLRVLLQKSRDLRGAPANDGCLAGELLTGTMKSPRKNEHKRNGGVFPRFLAIKIAP